MADQDRITKLEARVVQLEQRLQALESAPARGSGRTAQASAPAADFDSRAWTRTYEAASLEVSDTWIELHEPSARPQLQRLIREVVDVEGPVTSRLVLDRVRRAWGLKRAGGRVQEAFDQALRQLLARGLVERDEDALRAPRQELDQVRIPGEEEATRRAAEDVPLVELALAIGRAARASGGRSDEEQLTMQVAKLFGWTRRGGAIQERLAAALALAEAQGRVDRSASGISAR